MFLSSFANRSLSTPFDIVVEGRTDEISPDQVQEKLSAWAEAGATWWIEGLWQYSQEQASARIQQGPPQIAG